MKHIFSCGWNYWLNKKVLISLIYILCWYAVNPMTSPYTSGPPLSHCPQLLIQQMCSCLLHLKAHSTIYVYSQGCKTNTVIAGTVGLKKCEVLWWIYYNYLPSNALVSTTRSSNLKMIRLGLQYHSRHTQEVPYINLGHDTGYLAILSRFFLLPLHKYWYSPSIRHAHIKIPSTSLVTNCSNISATLTLQLSQLFWCRKFIPKYRTQ